MKRKSIYKKVVAKKSKPSDATIDMDSMCERNLGSSKSSSFYGKSDHNMREIDETEDCIILDFDPSDKTMMNAKLSIVVVDDNDDDDDVRVIGEKTMMSAKHSDVVADDNDDDDVMVIGEKGQVACRDYPHPRHLCAKHKFETTPHWTYCEHCYCFVCDVVAPCHLWTGTSGGHCHATGDEVWMSIRKAAREVKNMKFK